jgi:hypothetical protein
LLARINIGSFATENTEFTEGILTGIDRMSGINFLFSVNPAADKKL